MSASLPTTIRRILFALGEENDIAGAFEATASLAQQLGAELHGLFVEDADLLRLAGLPFARETGLATAASRRLQHPDIERGWQRQAARLQKNLSEVATRRQLRWSFQVVRGRMTAQVAEVALASDLVAVTSATRTTVETLQALGCPVLILPSGATLASPVGVLFDDTPESDTALRIAAAFVSTANEDGMSVFAVSTTGAGESAGKRAKSILADSGARAHVAYLAAPDAATLSRLLRMQGIRTLVLAAETVARLSWLRPLLDRPPCAVWLTR